VSLKRILRDQKLIEEIAKRLEQGTVDPGPAANVSAGERAADELRRVAEKAQRGLESNLSSSFLEAVIRRQGRPVFFIQGGHIETPDTGVWTERIEAARAALEISVPSVGRIDLAGSADRRVASGTGWLVAPDVVVTNRHVAVQFASQGEGGFVFNVNPNLEPVQVSIDFEHEYQRSSQRAFEIIGIIHIEPGGPNPDVAMLQVRERDRNGSPQPGFLRPADADPEEGSLVGVVGYAAADPVLTPQDVLTSIFQGVYDVKRFHPGETLAPTRRDLTHDCSTLGGNSGSVVLDFTTGKAVGLHYSGYFEKQNYAVPATRLREILHRLRIDVPA
jgi:endonuclease G